MHTAITEDGKVFAEAYFCDSDTRQEIRLLRTIEDFGQGGQYGIIVMCVVPELRDSLRDQDVEPIQRFWLVGVDIVVGLGENGGSGQRRGVTQDAGKGAFSV